MFSPSQTKTFSRCRFKWFLHKLLGTDYSTVGKRDLAAAVGTAVGAAIQSHYLLKGTLSIDQLIAQAQERYTYEVAERCKAGRVVEDCEEAVTYPGLIPGMIRAFFKKKPIPDEWIVTNAESTVSDDYNAFLDLAGTCPRSPWIADIKCKMNEKGGFIRNSLLKYQYDPQLLQYVREWSKKGEKVEFYRIIYIVGGPIPTCAFEDFEIDWDYMLLREVSDCQIWSEMLAAQSQLKALASIHGGYSRIPLDKVVEITPMASEHMDGFYKCDMWDPCLLYAGDVKHTPNYIQIERKL